MMPAVMQIAIQSPVLRKIVEAIPFVKRCWVGLVCRAWPPPWQVRYLSLEPVTEADRQAALRAFSRTMPKDNR